MQQLAQPIQLTTGYPVDEHVYELKQGIVLGTVDALELRYARSVTDNRRHGDHVILYADHNPFGEDGAIAYEWKGSIEDVEEHPIYPKDHDPSADWTGPAQKLADQVGPPERTGRAETAILKNRIDRNE